MISGLVFALTLAACAGAGPETQSTHGELPAHLVDEIEASIARTTQQLSDPKFPGGPEMRKQMLLYRSLDHFTLKQLNEGIADITEMLAMDVHFYEGDLFWAHFMRGGAYFKLAEYDKALSDLLIAESLQKDKVNLYLMLGDVYYRKSEYERALEQYTTAIDRDHYLAIAYAARAQVHRKLGDKKRAQQDFERALELGYDPKKQN